VDFRDGSPADLAAVHALNQSAVPAVGDETAEAMHALIDMAACFRVAEDDDGLAGFLLVLRPEAPYGSGNFLWFRERYESFLYIDRIVIRSDQRGRGLGRRFYRDLETFAAGRVPMITCEVNTRPRNEPSLAFHARLGYEEVGSRNSEGGAKTVVMLRKRLDPRPPSVDPPPADA
jgi:predicted GNAT superfamily acetyltransferase